MRREPGQAVEGEEGRQDGEEDEAQADDREAPRPLLVAQVAQRDRHEGVRGDDQEQQAQQLTLPLDLQRRCQGVEEEPAQQHEEAGASPQSRKGRDVDIPRALVFIGKAEESRLHPVGQEDHQERRPGIEVGHLPELLRLHHAYVDIGQQPVEETAEHTAQPIERGVLDQRLEGTHSCVSLA